MIVYIVIIHWFDFSWKRIEGKWLEEYKLRINPKTIDDSIWIYNASLYVTSVRTVWKVFPTMKSTIDERIVDENMIWK